MEFVILSGLSGAGKSRAVSFMEDMGFFCVDNMPVPLIPKFAELGAAGTGGYDRVVLVTDVRTGTDFDALFQALDGLSAMNCTWHLLFMDAADDVIIKRYKETRRTHPLEDECDTLEQAIALERRILEPMRQRAEYVLDTSDMPTAKLKDELRRLFGHNAKARESMRVSVISFGFKFGIPREADLVFDVRFLPNPFYVPELRSGTGLDEGVRSFIFADGQAEEFLEKLEGLLSFLLPRYVAEGKTTLSVCVGCTGGHHRSVALAHEVAGFVQTQGYTVMENHRDMARM